jgi:hypothetical protein
MLKPALLFYNERTDDDNNCAYKIADWERYLFIQLEIKDGIIQYIDYNLLD